MTTYTQEVERLAGKIVRAGNTGPDDARDRALELLRKVEDERLAKCHGTYDIVDGRYERGNAAIVCILRDLEEYSEWYWISMDSTIDAIIEGMFEVLSLELLHYVTNFVDAYPDVPEREPA